jgi:hypothetical protein
MEICSTLILKEARGFDRSFQLMFQPNSFLTQNENWISKDNTNIGFDLNGRFKELLKYGQDNGHMISEEKECVVAFRKIKKSFIIRNKKSNRRY